MVFQKPYYLLFSFVFLLRVSVLKAQTFAVEKIAVGKFNINLLFKFNLIHTFCLLITITYVKIFSHDLLQVLNKLDVIKIYLFYYVKYYIRHLNYQHTMVCMVYFIRGLIISNKSTLFTSISL